MQWDCVGTCACVFVSGEPVYEACLTKVEKVLYRKVTKVSEGADMDFYAFSYYYDRAVDLGVIGRKLTLKIIRCSSTAGCSVLQHLMFLKLSCPIIRAKDKQLFYKTSCGFTATHPASHRARPALFLTLTAS